MNAKVASTLLIIAVMIFGGCERNQQSKGFYDKAGIIKIQDPMASLVGYKKKGEDYFKISLDDIGKYTGHVCGGIASGYILTKKALEDLYPNKEIPVRGNIRVVASKPTDHIDVASYITGARAHYGRDEINRNDLLIDQSLQGKKNTVTLIFKRKDNGKMVKVIFDKIKLFSPELRKIIWPLKEKIEKGKATDKEKQIFAQKMQLVVKKAITNMPEGVITITKCTNYTFPEK